MFFDFVTEFVFKTELKLSLVVLSESSAWNAACSSCRVITEFDVLLFWVVNDAFCEGFVSVESA